MDHAALDVMKEYPDIQLAFGESDEFSFLLRKSSTLYNRRQSKIVTTITSLFTSSFVFHWPSYFPGNPLKYPPSFDGRIVLYPGERDVRDYFSWRQVDTHINNLYNTVFWALVRLGGETTTQAHATLRGTISSQKNEILFSRFGINYNEIEARFRKGSVIFRERVPSNSGPEQLLPLSAATDNDDPSPTPFTTGFEPRNTSPTRDVSAPLTSPKTTKNKLKQKTRITVAHCDIIKDDFWDARRYLLT